MDLHQIQVTYQLIDDRILVRATFKQPSAKPLEVRAWFTRRFVKILWPGLSATMQAQAILNQPQAAHLSAEIVDMEKHTALDAIKAQGSFDTPFETSEHLFPLGELPLLIDNVEFTLHAHQPILIHFSDERKTGVGLNFTPTLLHGFCSLLQQAVNAADWGMDLQLPDTSPAEGTPRVLN